MKSDTLKGGGGSAYLDLTCQCSSEQHTFVHFFAKVNLVIKQSGQKWDIMPI